MALPAGRYGVTKKQLNKVKNLPVNTIGMIEEAIQGQEQLLEGTVGWIQRNLVFNTIPYANINADGSIRTSEYSLAVAKVKANNVYTISPISTVFVYGFFTSEPTINSISYNGSRSVVNYTSAQAETFTAPIDGYIVVRFGGESSIQAIQVEDGSTATPIRKPIEETKADNSVIAPVENQATCQNSDGYAVGEHFIRNGKFCSATQLISSGGTLTEDTNYVSGDVADNMLKKATFSGTTNASGNLALVMDARLNIIAVVMDGEQIALPYISQYGNTSIHVLSSTMNALANTSVSGTYYYI